MLISWHWTKTLPQDKAVLPNRLLAERFSNLQIPLSPTLCLIIWSNAVFYFQSQYKYKCEYNLIGLLPCYPGNVSLMNAMISESSCVYIPKTWTGPNWIEADIRDTGQVHVFGCYTRTRLFHVFKAFMIVTACFYPKI